MNEKTVSALSAMARAAAEKSGHRVDLADAFISKEKEVKIGDAVIDKADSLLTLSAQEAAKMYDGKTLLAAGIADSLDAMLKQAGLTGPVQTVEPSGFEQVAFWITALAPLFLLGGILGAYIEFKTPGFGLPGILSACCFLIFFTGHYLAGLAGWEVGALFIVGLLLVIGELFLHPGTVIPGLVGALLMVAALLWAMIDRYPGEPFLPTTEMLMRPLVNSPSRSSSPCSPDTGSRSICRARASITTSCSKTRRRQLAQRGAGGGGSGKRRPGWHRAYDAAAGGQGGLRRAHARRGDTGRFHRSRKQSANHRGGWAARGGRAGVSAQSAASEKPVCLSKAKDL